MSDLFLTKPRSKNSHLLSKKKNTSFSYYEQVTDALMQFGVPLRVAEIAVIDMRYEITVFHKETKLNPKQTAVAIIDVVRQRYKDKKGWHYQ